MPPVMQVPHPVQEGCGIRGFALQQGFQVFRARPVFLAAIIGKTRDYKGNLIRLDVLDVFYGRPGYYKTRCDHPLGVGTADDAQRARAGALYDDSSTQIKCISMSGGVAKVKTCGRDAAHFPASQRAGILLFEFQGFLDRPDGMDFLRAARKRNSRVREGADDINDNDQSRCFVAGCRGCSSGIS